MTWVKRLLGRPSKVGPADPVEPDYYQRIGAAIAAVVAGEFDKALGHFEVEEDTINGDVIFLRDGRLAFRFGSPELNDLVHEFWEYWRDQPGQAEWRLFSMIVADGRFSAELAYPDQVDESEDVFERRDRIVTQHFGALAVDYSGPDGAAA